LTYTAVDVVVVGVAEVTGVHEQPNDELVVMYLMSQVGPQ
jgi:hypothetical protein